MEHKEFVQSKLPKGVEIITIYRTGSTTFCQSIHDEDYIVLVRGNFADTTLANGIDYFIINEKSMIDSLTFKTQNRNSMHLITTILRDKFTIYGKWDYKFDLLSHEKEYKDMMIGICDNSILHPTAFNFGYEDFCTKLIWYALLPLIMFKRKSIEVTPLMVKLVQEAHAQALPRCWINWARNELGLTLSNDCGYIDSNPIELAKLTAILK